MADPDWIARGIAGGSAALSFATLTFSRRDSRWKRRHAVMHPLRSSIEDLMPPVYNANDPNQVRDVFNATVGSALRELDEKVGRVPDPKFQKRARRVVAALDSVRSARPTGDGPVQLTPPQLKKLEAAKPDLEWIEDRMNRAEQRGVT